jgi:hypothetical protein
MLKFFSFILAITIIPNLAFAKTISKYNVAVKVENQGLGQAGDIAGAIGMALGGYGFACTASLGVSQIETIQDAKGQDIQKTFEHKSDFSLTAFGQPQAAGEIPVNFGNKNPHLDINIYQTCSGNKPSTCYDSKNRPYSCTEFVSIPMQWNCSIAGSQYPGPSPTDRQNIAAARNLQHEYECKPNNNMAMLGMFTGGIGASLVLNALNQKKITTTLSYLGKTEHIEKINCPSDAEIGQMDPALQKMFRLSGGISDAHFANAADYQVSVNGLGPVYKHRDDGLANFDVLYCKKNKDENVELEVGVKTSSKDYGVQTFMAEKGNVISSKRFDYKRGGMLWGSWDSQVQVQTVPATITTAK